MKNNKLYLLILSGILSIAAGAGAGLIFNAVTSAKPARPDKNQSMLVADNMPVQNTSPVISNIGESDSSSKPSYQTEDTLRPDAQYEIPVDTQAVGAASAPTIDNSAESTSALDILAISKVTRIFNERTRFYKITIDTTQVSSACSAIYTLYDEKKKSISSSDTGAFSNVPQTEKGVYYVSVKDKKTGIESELKQISGCVIKKISPKRIEDICNSGDYGTMTRAESYSISPSLTFNCTGNVGVTPTNIADICTKISLGVWTKVKIDSMHYDQLYRVDSINLTVL